MKKKFKIRYFRVRRKKKASPVEKQKKKTSQVSATHAAPRRSLAFYLFTFWS